jgi:hypothetical protein
VLRACTIDLDAHNLTQRPDDKFRLQKHTIFIQAPLLSAPTDDMRLLVVWNCEMQPPNKSRYGSCSNDACPELVPDGWPVLVPVRISAMKTGNDIRRRVCEFIKGNTERLYLVPEQQHCSGDIDGDDKHAKQEKKQKLGPSSIRIGVGRRKKHYGSLSWHLRSFEYWLVDRGVSMSEVLTCCGLSQESPYAIMTVNLLPRSRHKASSAALKL